MRQLQLFHPCWFFALMLCIGASISHAHEMQPAYLELRQTSPEKYEMMWKVPVRPDLINLRTNLPQDVKILSQTPRIQTSDASIERSTLTSPGGLDGKAITIDPAAGVLIDTLVRVVRLDGSIQVGRLNALTTSFLVEGTPGLFEQSITYARLGIEHILMGVDHLLFVLGLLLIVKDRWMLTKTITSFTIAHSITLAIATLGFASAPLPPLNAAIALSILFLGPEIVRKERGETSLTIRHPWVVAFAFGLLHGFGFASGLTTLGLSSTEIPLALLLFNVGVEIGQLFFVAVILLLERSFRTLEIQWPNWALKLPAYSVGGLGAYWTIQRTLILIGGL